MRYYDYAINENGNILSFGTSPADYSTDVLKNRAVRFILDQAGSNQAFFLYVASKAAHAEGKHAIPSRNYEQALADVTLPKGPAFNEENVRHKSLKPPRLSEEATRELGTAYRAALQSLQSVDDLVEALVGALKSAGKLDDTVIIYTSDNGYLFGEHRMIGKSAAYEESIRVPLLLRGPDIPANETRSQLVDNLDVVATIVDLARREPSIALDGRSFCLSFRIRTPHGGRRFCSRARKPLPGSNEALQWRPHLDAKIR